MLFFPGAIGAGDFWAPAAACLPEAWETRLLSWPGAGEVPPSPEINGYRDLIEFAAASVPDGADVVAQSMGGVVAIGLALARPRKIRRLVLVATSGGVDVGGLAVADWRAEYRAEFPQAAPWVSADRIDYTEQLGALQPPVCLIWGDADPLSPVAVGELLHSRLRSSTLHVIAGGTHALARERPAEVAALIARHLSESAAA